MTLPVRVLAGFALWTIVLLTAMVGVYRWSRILTGRAEIGGYGQYTMSGRDWYQRALRAHANGVENLPILIALVVALQASGITGAAIDWMAATIFPARMVQSVVHVAYVHSNLVTSIRFACFLIQLLCFLGLAGEIVAATLLV